MVNRTAMIVLTVLLVLLLLGGNLIRPYTDWFWFRQVQYSGVFLRIIITKFWVGVAAAAFLFGLLWINLRIACRRTRTTLVYSGRNLLAIPERHLMDVNRESRT